MPAQSQLARAAPRCSPRISEKHWGHVQAWGAPSLSLSLGHPALCSCIPHHGPIPLSPEMSHSLDPGQFPPAPHERPFCPCGPLPNHSQPLRRALLCPPWHGILTLPRKGVTPRLPGHRRESQGLGVVVEECATSPPDLDHSSTHPLGGPSTQHGVTSAPHPLPLQPTENQAAVL